SVARAGLPLALLAFCLHLDRRSSPRLFPAHLLSLARPSSLGVWIVGLMYAAEAGPPLYNTYFVQIGRGSSVYVAGEFASIVALSWSACAILVARIGRPCGPAMVVTGPALLAAGLGLLVFWPAIPLAVAAIGPAAVGSGFAGAAGFRTPY